MSDLCRQCSEWTDDPWAICADCRAQGYYNLQEDRMEGIMITACIPCRIAYKGTWYHIDRDGTVCTTDSPTSSRWVNGPPVEDRLAELIRREASRATEELKR